MYSISSAASRRGFNVKEKNQFKRRKIKLRKNGYDSLSLSLSLSLLFFLFSFFYIYYFFCVLVILQASPRSSNTNVEHHLKNKNLRIATATKRTVGSHSILPSFNWQTPNLLFTYHNLIRNVIKSRLQLPKLFLFIRSFIFMEIFSFFSRRSHWIRSCHFLFLPFS